MPWDGGAGNLTAVFDFSDAPGPVRQAVIRRFELNWDQLGEPGTWFDGEMRIRIAGVARAARSRSASPDKDVSSAAAEVASKIAAEPTTTTKGWVDRMVAELGEEEYVETMGIATRVVMVDTFCRLMGIEPPPLPAPRAGEPPRIRVEPKPRKVRSWIAVGNTLDPPHTQNLVPGENQQTYPTIETLYMTGAEMKDPDFSRGDLHRTQMELVASVVSYGNECFY